MSVSTEQFRLEFARAVVDIMTNALVSDLYPNASAEGLFGIDMGDGIHAREIRQRNTGKLPYAVWKSLRLQNPDGFEQKLTEAFCSGSVQTFFEQSLIAMQPQQGSYGYEILCRGLRSIRWDTATLSKIAQLPSLTVARWAKLRGLERQSFNGLVGEVLTETGDGIERQQFRAMELVDAPEVDSHPAWNQFVAEEWRQLRAAGIDLKDPRQTQDTPIVWKLLKQQPSILVKPENLVELESRDLVAAVLISGLGDGEGSAAE
ncbi:unnamed protein product, partial [Symbiodinium necroappetens]